MDKNNLVAIERPIPVDQSKGGEKESEERLVLEEEERYMYLRIGYSQFTKQEGWLTAQARPYCSLRKTENLLRNAELVV